MVEVIVEAEPTPAKGKSGKEGKSAKGAKVQRGASASKALGRSKARSGARDCALQGRPLVVHTFSKGFSVSKMGP